jgi:4-hydroxybenzoate polyprenyltransferase/phosphoserine phosphatase
MKINMPLCVDLDGTLIRTDLMFECIVLLLKKNPLYIFIIPFWILKGRYFFKNKLDEFVEPDYMSIPVNLEVIKFAENEKKKGRKIILITASIHKYAEKFKERFSVFDEAIGSKDGLNLVGKAKAKYLADRFGNRGFDYIGDNIKDCFVWQHSRLAHIVNPTKKVIESAKKVSEIGEIFICNNTNFLKTTIKEMRVYQWVKNLLIFLPVILAHEYSYILYIQSLIAFISFSFSASAIYIVNDLFDLESDRCHPTKSKRPIANGDMKIIDSFKIILFLILTSLIIAIGFLPPNFVFILLAYLILTGFYSFKLKKIYILDIITLASLYTLRIGAGSAATNVYISEWLAAFSLFFFVSLAAVKRFTELKNLSQTVEKKIKGRGYQIDDTQLIQTFGVSSGLISVLVLVLYINSPKIIQLYSIPYLLYLIIPLFLYWILRVWFLAHRGELNEDPILFAVTDKTSYIIGFITMLLVFGAA